MLPANVRRELAELSRSLFGVAARLLAAGAFSEHEVYALRGILRHATPARIHVAAAAHGKPPNAQRHLAALRRRLAELTRRAAELPTRAEPDARTPPPHLQESTAVQSSEGVSRSVSEQSQEGCAAGPSTAMELTSTDSARSSGRRDEDCTLEEVRAALAIVVRSESPGDHLPARDELSGKALERVGRLHHFVLLVRGGATVEEAIKQTGVRYQSANWVRAILKRYEEKGLAGLYDGRWANRGSQHVSDEVRGILLGWYLTRRCARPKQLHELVERTCISRGLPPPTYPWVKYFLHERLDPAIRLVRESGMEGWEKLGAPVGVWDPSLYSNHWWQGDNNVSDIWLQRFNRAGKRIAAQLYTSGAIDVHSRAISGLTTSLRHYDAWTTALLLRHAIMPKRNPDYPVYGRPENFVYDLGREFDNAPVANSIALLGIVPRPCRGANPDEKAEIERFFRTYQEGFLSKLPGYKPAGMKSIDAARKHVRELLSLAEFRQEAEGWLVHTYLRRPHAAISSGEFDRSPGTYWQETVRLSPVPADELDVLLLQSDKVRTIGTRGIRLSIGGRKMLFAHESLADHIGEKARLRLNPDDVRYPLDGTPSIIVYQATSGKRICEAFQQPERGSSSMNAKLMGARKRLRKALRERMVDYVARVEEHDRENPRDWDDARSIAAASPQIAPATKEEPPGVTSLLEVMERRDRAVS
jgi:putative transposase